MVSYFLPFGSGLDEVVTAMRRERDDGATRVEAGYDIDGAEHSLEVREYS
jgi:hypothetical protein